MPNRGRQTMVADYQNLPVAVLHVLTKYGRKGIADVIPATHARRLINFSAVARNSQIVLVILIADQIFVKVADAIENALSPAAINDGIDVPFEVGIMGTGAANRKWRVKHSANSAFLVGGGGGAHWSANVIGAGLAQDGEALLDVIRRVNGVGIHANDHFAAGLAKGGVQASRHDPPGIVQQPHFRIFCAETLQEFTRAVVGDTVCDNNLEVNVGHFLSEDGLEAVFDIAGLVPAGEDYRNQRRVGCRHG